MEPVRGRIFRRGPEFHPELHWYGYRHNQHLYGGLPSTNVGSFSQIGATDSLAKNRVDANWHFVDNYSWKSGKHDVKFGYEFRRTTIAQVFDHDFRGTLGFSGLTTFLEGLPDGDGDGSGSQIQGDTERHTYQNSDGLL